MTNTNLLLNSYNYVAVYADGDVTFDRATVVIHSLTDDGIEIYGDLTATDSTFDFTVGDVGFDIYGNALFERCEILLNTYDDAIWVDEDLTMVDCTVEISNEDDDSIRVYGDATVIDCTLKLKSDEDGLDVNGKLNMHSCDVSVDAGDTAIEVGVESGSSVSLYDSGLTL